MAFSSMTMVVSDLQRRKMLVSEGMMMDWNLDYRNIVFLYYSEEIDIINENMWTEGMNAENGHVAP